MDIAAGHGAPTMAKHGRDGWLTEAQRVRRRREAVAQRVKCDALDLAELGNPFPSLRQSRIGRTVVTGRKHGVALLVRSALWGNADSAATLRDCRDLTH